MIYYRIEGANEMFRTLRNAKSHVWLAYTQQERVKYLTGCSIYKIDGETILSETPINVTTDGYSFGQTRRL